MFENVKAAQHSEEEIANEDLKPAEEAPTTGQVEEPEVKPEAEEDTSTNEAPAEPKEEESIESLRERLAKAERDRDNYKQGMLSKKAKSRTIQPEPKAEVDLNEQVVMEVLGKQSERTALRNTIDAKHSDYIPELVDDSNYNEIITYLPRSMDKSDYASIVKSLRLATKLWKEEKGIKDEKPAKVHIPSPKTTQAQQSKPAAPATGRKILSKSRTSMENWY